MTTKEKIIKKINELPTEEIKKMIIQLNDDFQDGATTVFVLALDVLENRINENEYVKFCESL